MLSPKRTKFRKMHKGRTPGNAKGGNEVSFGDFGMQVLEPGWITARQIEAARVAISRAVKKGGKIDDKVIEARLDALYKGTKLEDEATRLELLTKATPKSLKASKDPFIKLAVALWPTLKAREAADDKKSGEYMLLSPMYAKAMIEALGGFVAPDSLRFTDYSDACGSSDPAGPGVLKGEHGYCQGRGNTESGRSLLCTGSLQFLGQQSVLCHVSGRLGSLGNRRLHPPRVEPRRASCDFC